MDKLWAPWRAKYVAIIGKPNGCIFCQIQREKKDKKNFLFLRKRHSYSVLNIYPYNNGHVLVVPYRHVRDLSQLQKDEREDILDLLEETKKLLDRTLKPQGYNIGINLGRVAGAGFPGHLHIHIVPRWKGDVNFMPVIGDVRILSFSLKTLFDRLIYQQKRR